MSAAMISTLGEGDWEEIDQIEAEKLVREDKAYRCTLCDDQKPLDVYDDGLPSFHYVVA